MTKAPVLEDDDPLLVPLLIDIIKVSFFFCIWYTNYELLYLLQKPPKIPNQSVSVLTSHASQHPAPIPLVMHNKKWEEQWEEKQDKKWDKQQNKQQEEQRNNKQWDNKQWDDKPWDEYIVQPYRHYM